MIFIDIIIDSLPWTRYLNTYEFSRDKVDRWRNKNYIEIGKYKCKDLTKLSRTEFGKIYVSFRLIVFRVLILVQNIHLEKLFGK